MANHIKAGILIEKKVYVVHIETRISTKEKMGMLYIPSIKINMFTTETREKKGYVVHTKTSMFTTEIQEKTVCCTY